MGRKAFATKIKPPSTRREESPEAHPPPNPQPPAPTQQAAIAETEELSPVDQETEPLDDEAISAHYDSNPEDRAERLRKKNQDREGGSIAEEMLTVETVRQERVREEIDLNASAQKRDLMTDTEFVSIVEEVNRREDTALMAEGLDLASRSVGGVEKAVKGTIPEVQTSQSVVEAGEEQSEEKELEPVDPQVEAGDDRIQEEEEGPTVEIQVPEAVASPILKPQLVKRRLILKKGPMTERPKSTRVSQRCLGKWAASKAPTNTAENPVEIASEEEQGTPKKAEGKPTQATDQEDTGGSPIQGEQGTKIKGVAEGPDLAPGSVRPEEADDVDDQAPGETILTAQEEEAQYQQARKRKEKAPIRKKSVTKKSRVANTGIVITEASQRTPPSQGELSDSEYTASEESDSDSDISLEAEEYGEQSLPDDHRELVHPPVERLRYK
ncbi:neurofilament heavy polypeptide-like [Salvia splendens]|uniref:neurofilament heavy polypeptide-like n=1 Tax=Salvia splendens TaxID=180675 RepID=UPI001C264B90|nr:neurofilament heavy polypeptide-like [Salvia splendens]